MTDTTSMPKFRTEGPRHACRVFLQCSKCYADIRELKPKDTIQTDRGHYCKNCDDDGRGSSYSGGQMKCHTCDNTWTKKELPKKHQGKIIMLCWDCWLKIAPVEKTEEKE